MTKMSAGALRNILFLIIFNAGEKKQNTAFLRDMPTLRVPRVNVTQGVDADSRTPTHAGG